MNIRSRIATSFPTCAMVIGLASLLSSATAHAALVLHLPLNDASSGGVTTAAAAINDAGHPTTFGTSVGTGDAWFNDPTRGNVYFSNQGSRLTAGTQGIDRTVGFTWSMWVKIDPAAAGNADAGSDVVIGTRTASGGVWHKVQFSDSQTWAAVSFGANSLATNAWRHMAYIGDSTNVRMYIDGLLVGTPDTTTPTTTFNGNFEIGGSGQFTEDSEGYSSDLGVWTEALTGDEVKGLFDISNASPGLLYDVAEFDQLKQIHDLGSGSVTIGSQTWYYSNSLVGSAGLTQVGSDYNLILNAANGTGLTTIIPEPSSLAMLAFGMISLWLFRKKQSM